MFDIQEIDDLVCRQLSQHDLAQCARVNRKWHAIVIPHIWRSLQCLHKQTPQGQLFRRMVLEDYVRACALEEEGYPMEQHTRLWTHHISTLSKYAPLIRELPGLRELVGILLDPNVSVTGQSKEPMEYQLAAHLFNRCRPDVEFASVGLVSHDIDLDDAQKAANTFTLPRASCLVLYVSRAQPHSVFKNEGFTEPMFYHTEEPGYLPRHNTGWKEGYRWLPIGQRLEDGMDISQGSRN
ncbi:hypothetical protein B0O80DRAFT_454092, partial [Mortierella sp. GBAus27b]